MARQLQCTLELKGRQAEREERMGLRGEVMKGENRSKPVVAGWLLQRSYDVLKQSVYDALALQTRLKDYLDAVTADDSLVTATNWQPSRPVPGRYGQCCRSLHSSRPAPTSRHKCGAPRHALPATLATSQASSAVVARWRRTPPPVHIRRVFVPSGECDGLHTTILHTMISGHAASMTAAVAGSYAGVAFMSTFPVGGFSENGRK